MKKLLATLSILSIAVVGCAKSTKSNVSDPDKIVFQLGDAEITKEQMYTILKNGGQSIVENWFKEAILYDKVGSQSETDELIDNRIDLLIEEAKLSIVPQRPNEFSVEDIYENSYRSQGYETEQEYRKFVLRDTAITELFTELYVKETSRIEGFISDYKPRNIWAIKVEEDTKAREFSNQIISGEKEFHELATWNYNDYWKSVSDDDFDYQGQLNKEKGLQGLDYTTYQTDTIEYVDSSLVGWEGYTLVDDSSFPDKVNDVLFNEDHEKIIFNEKGLLDFGDKTLEEGEIGFEKFYITISKSESYIIKADLIEYDEETDTDEHAIRQIGKVSTIKTRAQSSLFSGYKNEAWDQTIWDLISSNILDNKDS